MEKISETITITNDCGNYYYWVRVVKENRQITGKMYQDKEKCIEAAKVIDAKNN